MPDKSALSPVALETEPAWTYLSDSTKLTHLEGALAGVELGRHDRQVLAMIASGLADHVVYTLASLLSRARTTSYREVVGNRETAYVPLVNERFGGGPR